MRTVHSSSLVIVLVAGLFLAGCGGTDATVDADTDSETTQPPELSEAPELVQEYQALLDPEEMAARMYYLASDRFEGRETAMPGQHKAAEYLASQYRKMGVAPKGTVEAEDPRAPEAYFQEFTVYGTRTTHASLTATQQTDTLATGTYDTTLPNTSTTFLPLGTLPEQEGGLIFAGYGIGQSNFNDYNALDDAGLTVDGDWLMFLRSDPVHDDGTHLFTGTDEPSTWTDGLNRKLQIVRDLGRFGDGEPAAGVLIVADIGPKAVDVTERARILADYNEPGSMSLTEEEDSSTFPVYMVSTEFADALLAEADQSVETIQQEVLATESPVVFDVPDVTVDSRLERTPYAKPTDNVVAHIEGSDPDLKDEVIVITSHYDHIGLEQTGPQDNYINNGADDNASGTIATVALAEAFRAAKDDGYGPRRSLLFLNVSAEEKGLLGSAYYADEEPIYPLEQTVANLNLDMIGRVDPSYPELPDSNYVYVIGGNLISDDLDAINREANALTGIDYTLHERYNDPNDPQALYRRSDQWNFGKHNIPFIFYFSGLHDDYHDVGDEAHKIDYERMAERTRLVFGTTWQLANQDDRPAVTGEGFH